MNTQQRTNGWSASDLQALGWPALDETRFVQTTKTEDFTPLPEEEQTRDMRLWLKYGQPKQPQPAVGPFPWHIPVATVAYLTGLVAFAYLLSRR